MLAIPWFVQIELLIQFGFPQEGEKANPPTQPDTSIRIPRVMLVQQFHGTRALAYLRREVLDAGGDVVFAQEQVPLEIFLGHSWCRRNQAPNFRIR